MTQTLDQKFNLATRSFANWTRLEKALAEEKVKNAGKVRLWVDMKVEKNVRFLAMDQFNRMEELRADLKSKGVKW